MGIRANFNMSDIHAFMQNKITNLENNIIQSLSYLGEQCVNNCKTNRGYLDQTGNLNSSIGYIIVANGSAIRQSGFEVVKEGQKGKSEGENLARELATKYSTGFALIVVAGMDYAFFVENGGRNVLTSGELYAKKQMPKIIKQLKQYLKNTA
jgi:hypothetical protein